MKYHEWMVGFDPEEFPQQSRDSSCKRGDEDLSFAKASD